MKLDHVNISAPRALLDKDKAFLCSVFDLKEGYRPQFSSHGYWLYWGAQPIFHLSESDEHGASEKPFYLDHVAFQMQGLSKFMGVLETKNIQFTKKYQEPLSLTQVFLKTPSGVRLEIGFKGEQLS